jgi:tetraacyldisaccharide 4'-kinase
VTAPRVPWLERREESIGRRIALAPLVPLAWIYGAFAALHRTVYARGWRARRRLGCRVVSVGNLTVGGSGKTPFAAWLATGLRRRGHRVVLASRGHGRRSTERVVVVSDGTYVRSAGAASGDEPFLLAGLAPGVPVLVGPDRGVIGLRAVAAFGAEVLVLDDGFQHHRLDRDADVLLVDGGFGFGNRRVLPRGPLREPLRALAGVHALGVLDGPLAPEDEALVARLAPRAFRFVARRHPVSIRALGGGSRLPATLLEGQSVGILAGLARPDSLRRTLATLGARIVAERVFPDHHRYRPSDLAGLEGEAKIWVTTEKDAVKIPAAWAGGADVRVLAIRLEVEDGGALLDRMEALLR